MAKGGGFEYIFTLLDKFSGPAEKLEKTLERTGEAFESAAHKAQHTENALGGAGKAATVFGLKFGNMVVGTTSKLVGWGIAAFEVGMKLGEMGAGFLEASVEMQTFRQNSLQVLTAMTGSSEAAGELFERAEMFSKLTPFKSEQIVGSWQTLLGAGFKKEELDGVTETMMDIARGNSGVYDELTSSFLRLRAVGADSRVVKSLLRPLANAGVSMDMVKANLEKALGVSGPAVDALLRKKGAISGDVFVQAVRASIAGVWGGSGKSAIQQAQQIPALMQRISNSWDSLKMAFGAAHPEGLQFVQAALSEIADLLGGTTPLGAEFLGVLDDIGKAFYETFFPNGQGKTKNIHQMLEDMVTWMKGVKWNDVFGNMKAAIETVADLMQKVVDGYRLLGAIPGDVKEHFQEEARGNVAIAVEAGKKQAAQEAAQLGAGDDYDAQVRLLHPGRGGVGEGDRDRAGPTVRQNPSPGGGGGTTVHLGPVSINVDAGGHSDPHGIASALSAQLPSALVSALESLSFQSGAVGH